MKIINRIYEYLEYKDIPPTKFEKDIGLSNGYLGVQRKRSADIGESVIIKIIDNCRDLSLEWLILGVGSMLKSKKHYPADGDIPVAIASEAAAKYGINGIKPIPLVSLKVAAGFGSADFRIEEQDVKEYYVVPKFKHRRIDFMIEVAGSSMYPKYSSGDIIACTIIRDSHFIQWNKCHVIATTEQGLLVKRIKEGKDADHILAISDNEEYPPFEIPKSEISGIAIVTGVIRIE